MTTKIVLIGAGSAQFGFDMLGDIFQSDTLSGCHIVLHDIDPNALDRVLKSAKEFITNNKLVVTLTATTHRTEALIGADYCIISIEVGNRFALWELDKSIPLQYGITQVFGENGGVGGLFHALRIIPPILEICEDILNICPNAWVFNYSNPMSRICTTLTRKFPELKIVGLCHEIASLYQHLPHILDTPLSNLNFRAGGLNHFSILLEASYKDSGKNAIDEILEKSSHYFESLPDTASVMKRMMADKTASASDLMDKPKTWAERGVFKFLLENFKVLPITTDSHIGEYIQWAHEVADNEGILNFYRYYKQWTLEYEAEIKKTRSERLVKILEGMEQNTPYEESAVNIPNNGLISSLPDWIVVEVPAMITGSGVDGIALNDFPAGFRGLLSNQVAIHDLNAIAVLEKSKDAVIQALLVDPVVTKAQKIPELVDVMISQQEEFLGYLN
ncbi:MAG: hypothetical protein JKY88_07960 [Pseudomonadales bacterium]|nr:hypothetical protein [Pseudomonadales bacterium]